MSASRVMYSSLSDFTAIKLKWIRDGKKTVNNALGSFSVFLFSIFLQPYKSRSQTRRVDRRARAHTVTRPPHVGFHFRRMQPCRGQAQHTSHLTSIIRTKQSVLDVRRPFTGPMWVPGDLGWTIFRLHPRAAS